MVAMFFPEAAPLVQTLWDAAIAVASLQFGVLLGAFLYLPVRFTARISVRPRGLGSAVLRGVLGTSLVASIAYVAWPVAQALLASSGYHPIARTPLVIAAAAGYAVVAAVGRGERMHREATPTPTNTTALRALGLDAEEAR